MVQAASAQNLQPNARRHKYHAGTCQDRDQVGDPVHAENVEERAAEIPKHKNKQTDGVRKQRFSK